ncbi:MAG: zinc-dependent metalloprotease family protein [Gammaproteobacteria bacterium]
MNSLFRVVLLLALLSTPLFVAAEDSPDGVWSDVGAERIAATGKRPIIPDHYRALRLDQAALAALLAQAPMEDSGTTAIILTLPLPAGGFGRFSVVEAPIMAPELAARYPEIKTYAGQGIDDPSATLRFSVTPKGFHGQILSATGAIYIDPYQEGDRDHYISYAKGDYNPAGREPLQCLFQNPAPRAFSPLLPGAKISSGTQRRTYRTVIAATGEYTAFQGGTKNAALAAIVVALTRVNGVYEREVAVRMVLVANNDDVIYTDGATDPYTNNDGFTMLGENQSNVDTVIGSANYDIGHVFSTGGGGIASLESPCNATRKAQGVTGLSQPTGDPFYIDYVAHEMGHQFGGNHPFNGDTGACGGGNRNASTAYEPGSGSTIMAYAGICAPLDLQPHSDAYFHAISLEEIVNFINGNGAFGGNGDACSVKNATGNTPPTADAGSNAVPAFTIPKSTPFALTGTASDVNGDALTYDWEEFDLGPAGDPNTPSGNAPILRSFSPSASPTRTFPQPSDLLNNTQTFGELLPSYGRDLVFRLTVRDNRAGGGGINQDTIALKVADAAGPFQVTAPNTAVTWTGNSTQNVSWSVAGTNAAPVNCASVNIRLSTDGGTSFPTTILAGTPNDGSQAITVPNIATTQARIKVECATNVFFDISNVNFRINAGVSPDLIFSDSFE